ncbi:MAG TPA: efflux RND transporter periplasmic adaptor subunit [Bacteroidales bacterium]|nr:efflux RND transporter periplasmic adaptor subunit [Bacteroidales bacterium]
MKTFFRILVIVIVIGVFGFTIYYLYGKSKDTPVIYETTSAFIAPNIIKKTVATGSVNPRKEIDITPKVSGIIEEIFVEPGQMIKQGDVIARIKIIPNMLNLNNAESRVNRAEIALENAKRKYDRQKELYNDGVVAAAEFEQYELEYTNAQEELSSAQSNLELIKEGQTKQTGTTTNTLVRSTIDGMVLAVPVEQGNSVIESNTFNAGTTIATVADMKEMIFEGKIDETEVGKIKEGMPLMLQIGAIEDISFDAVLEHISPKGVEENGAIQFEIKADVVLRKDQFIRAGYSANADIVLARVDSVLAVPESVIQFEGDTAFVEIETTPQVFEKRNVELGLSDGINIEVVSGVSENEKIKVPIR